MFDKTSEVVLWLIISVVLLMLISIPIMKRFSDKVDWCGEKGGVMLKSTSGWRCIDAKVLKNERTN